MRNTQQIYSRKKNLKDKKPKCRKERQLLTLAKTYGLFLGKLLSTFDNFAWSVMEKSFPKACISSSKETLVQIARTINLEDYMTLITHIWTPNLNIISGEGRVINKQNKVLVSDNRKKIFAKENCFVAFHGCCDFNEHNVPRIINSFLENSSTTNNPIEIASELKTHLTTLNPNLETSFIVGGQHDNKVYSLYCSIIEQKILRDDVQFESGFRYNCESNEHYAEINEFFKRSFTNIFKTEFNLEVFESSTNEKIKSFLIEFHNHVSVFANKTGGIGLNTDIGIIRNNRFEWLIQNNNQLDP